MEEKAPLFRWLEGLHGKLEHIASQDLQEIQQTIKTSKDALSVFATNKMVDAAFDVCSKSLCSTFEKTDRCLTNVLSSNMTNQQLLLDLGKFDFLIKQKTDQMVFLFTDLAPGAAAVSKLTDENARRLWTSKFGPSACLVPWKEFVTPFASASGEQGALSDIDIESLRQFLDFTLDGWVSTYELQIFLTSFGPMQGCIQRMLTPFRTGVLAGYVSSLEANVLLSGRTAGSFLVRFSKSNPGAFAVTFVDSKLRIKHCLLFNAKPCGLTLKQPPDVFPSLEAFVKAHKERLVLPVGALAQRFRPLDVMVASGSSNPYTRSLSTEADNAYALDMGEADDVSSTRSCIVCMDGPVSSVFIPCGHAACCLKCGKAIEGSKDPRCPICRTMVNKSQQLYLV